MTLAYIHYIARVIAVQRGCEALGYSNSILLTSPSELTNRLIRYTGCPKNAVRQLVEDMTYGSGGITRPDPAIQSLINLNDDAYAILPNLFISSSMERNFAILLNRFPSEKAFYSCLVIEKESLMREWIKEHLSIPSVRYFSGKVASAGEPGDIDLAVISDSEKVCVFFELKWFIEPAEVREVSNSFIGMARVQHPSIPVVRHGHLVRKANSFGSLRKLAVWLSKREYLTIESKHYEAVKKIWRVGKWGLQ